MWSLGALLELEDRAKMEAFIVQHESSLSLPPVKGDETIFEYLVDDKGEIILSKYMYITITLRVQFLMSPELKK